MSANAKMKKFYGITTQEIYGDAAQGDEIPDADAEMETTPTPTPEEDDIQEEPSMPSLKDWEKSISLITEVSNFTASAGPGQTLTST